MSISRRHLLAGAGAAAFLLDQREAEAQTGTTTVFTHTTVVNTDVVQNDVALAVQNGSIAAIGPTDEIVQRFRGATTYDGRGKAIFPGLVNCHAHLNATIARGFNEDFGFPNSQHLEQQPNSLLSREENTLMVTVGALEAIKTGTTTLTEVAGNIANSADALMKTGLRMVFAESVGDRLDGGAMSPWQLTQNRAPVFSAKQRDDGMQRVNDLFTKWHGKNNGRISVFPAASLAEDCSPELLHAVRDFAEKHDVGYTIHLTQSVAEAEFMLNYHGLRPSLFLDKHDFLGPRLFAAHCRYVDDAEIAALGRTKTVISHQANMAANRGVIPPIPALRLAGAPIANGTDNNTNDMFNVMRIALLTERIRRTDAFPGVRPQPEDILEDATKGGAHALGQKFGGTLEVGKKADLIVINTQSISLVPAMRITSAWIHNGSPADIESVMVEGQFLMRDRKILTMDEAAIIAEADKIGKRVWGKVLAGSPVQIPGRKIKF